MRQDQYIGLNKWAGKLLDSQNIQVTIIGKKVYPDGKEESFKESKTENPILTKEYSSFEGFGKYPLNSYTFPDGRIFKEFVQNMPWSGGPVIFLALKDKEDKVVEESLWTEDEIESYL